MRRIAPATTAAIAAASGQGAPEPGLSSAVAGVVDQVGDGVDDRWLGRRVVTHLGLVNGGYAESAVGTEEALFEIAADLSFEAAVVWTLISPEVYELFVGDRGWSPDEYERWLSQALTDALAAR